MTEDTTRLTDAEALEIVGNLLTDDSVDLRPDEMASLARLLALAVTSIANAQRLAEANNQIAELRRQVLAFQERYGQG